MWRMLFLHVDDANLRGTVGFAALLNVVVSTYVGFISDIPEAVEIPKLGFAVWIIVGLIVSWGIAGG